MVILKRSCALPRCGTSRQPSAFAVPETISAPPGVVPMRTLYVNALAGVSESVAPLHDNVMAELANEELSPDGALGGRFDVRELFFQSWSGKDDKPATRMSSRPSLS